MARTLRMPLQVAANGGLVTLAHGSQAEVAQSVALLLATRPGERRSAPAFGLVDQLGAGLDEDTLLAAIAEHEPRATPTDVDVARRGATQQAPIHPAAQASTDQEA